MNVTRPILVLEGEGLQSKKLFFRRTSDVNYKCARLSQFLNYLVLYFVRTNTQLPLSSAMVYTSVTSIETSLIPSSKVYAVIHPR
jgi:hypothetical protein